MSVGASSTHHKMAGLLLASVTSRTEASEHSVVLFCHRATSQMNQFEQRLYDIVAKALTSDDNRLILPSIKINSLIPWQVREQ